MKLIYTAILLLTAFVFAANTTALPVNQVAYGSLTGTGLITFDDIAGGSAPGTNYNSIFESGGADFGERFSGQTLSYSGDFDIISGSPGGALALVAGAPGENLNIFNHNGSNVLTGLGNNGYPNFNAIGEGAFSVLFDYDQSEFGFQLVGGNNGSANVSFFQRDGDLIDSIILNNLSDAFYGFSRENGVNDIAGITVFNTDPAGIGFDNLLHDVPGNSGAPVPEPASMLLLGCGLVGIAGSRRHRRKAN